MELETLLNTWDIRDISLEFLKYIDNSKLFYITNDTCHWCKIFESLQDYLELKNKLKDRFIIINIDEIRRKLKNNSISVKEILFNNYNYEISLFDKIISKKFNYGELLHNMFNLNNVAVPLFVTIDSSNKIKRSNFLKNRTYFEIMKWFLE